MPVFLPGRYKIWSDLTTLKIHNSDDVLAPVVGNFFKNDTIDVYQVFPVNAKGIVWGMITPADAPVKKYIGMSVYGKPKVVRFADLPQEGPPQQEGTLLMKLDNLETEMAKVNQKLDALLARK